MGKVRHELVHGDHQNKPYDNGFDAYIDLSETFKNRYARTAILSIFAAPRTVSSLFV